MSPGRESSMPPPVQRKQLSCALSPDTPLCPFLLLCSEIGNLIVCRGSLRTQSIGECIGQQSSFYQVRPCLCESSSRNLGLENVMKPNPINGTLNQGPSTACSLSCTKRGELCRIFLGPGKTLLLISNDSNELNNG